MIFLILIVFTAFLTEAIVGFGSTVLTVTLGAHLMGIDALLVRFIPLNILLSSLLLVRSLRQVEGRFLLRSVLPTVGIGIAIGGWLFRYQSGPWLRLIFGAFVTTLALIELIRLRGNTPLNPTPLRPSIGRFFLLGGGIIHGLFGSGGPMIVYVLSRDFSDRGKMRATLAALWLILNGLLIINYVSLGRITTDTLWDSAKLLPALFFGLFLGDWLHHRLAERLFRWLVYLVLLLAGGTLTILTILQGNFLSGLEGGSTDKECPIWVLQ